MLHTIHVAPPSNDRSNWIVPENVTPAPVKVALASVPPVTQLLVSAKLTGTGELSTGETVGAADN